MGVTMRPFLILFFIVVSLILGCLYVANGASVAPGDADSSCFEEEAYVPPFSNEKVLLDTQNYRAQTLVGATGQNETWLSIDYDGLPGSGIDQVRNIIHRPLVKFK